MNFMAKKKHGMQTKWWLVGLLILALTMGGCGGGQPAEEAAAPSQKEASTEAPSQETTSADTAESGGDRDSVIAKLSSMTMPEELSYEMTYSSQGYNVTTKIWMKGDKSRMEGSSDMQGNYIAIEDGEYTYMLDPDEMTGIKMSFGDEDDFFEDDFDDDFMDGDYDWGNMEYLGTETINGIRTYVFQDDDDYEKIKVWIHADYGFPVRMEGEEEGETYVMEITNFKIGGVSDSVFKVPAGYEIMEMNW